MKNSVLRGLLTVGLVVSSFFAPQAFAAAPEDLSVLTSDSRASTAANYTITLDQAAGGDFSAGDTLVITFPSAFDTSGFASTDALDYDIEVNGTPETVVDSSDTCADDEIEVTTVASDVFTFTACSGYLGEAANTVIEIQIGTHATTGGTGNTQATSSTTGTYTFTVDTTDEDSKDALIAVTDGATLSATIDETLTFSVAAVNSGTCTVAGGTNVTSTPTTIPFGTLASDDFYNVCQDLTVGTNAAGGYSTTVQTTSLPTSGGNTIAKGSCSSGCTITSETAWGTDTNNGYGYCMDDTQGDGAATADAGWGTNGCGAGTQHFKLIANAGAAETAASVMSSAAATTINDQSYIGYRISIGSGQAAGAYTTTVVYIATPTF